MLRNKHSVEIEEILDPQAGGFNSSQFDVDPVHPSTGSPDAPREVNPLLRKKHSVEIEEIQDPQAGGFNSSQVDVDHVDPSTGSPDAAREVEPLRRDGRHSA